MALYVLVGRSIIDKNHLCIATKDGNHRISACGLKYRTGRGGRKWLPYSAPPGGASATATFPIPAPITCKPCIIRLMGKSGGRNKGFAFLSELLEEES